MYFKFYQNRLKNIILNDYMYIYILAIVAPAVYLKSLRILVFTASVFHRRHGLSLNVQFILQASSAYTYLFMIVMFLPRCLDDGQN